MFPKLSIEDVLSNARNQIQQVMEGSQVDDRDVIARYTAAVAVNFTDWIGKTIPWVQHEFARYALIDNLRCEATQDHVGMLLQFAALSDAMPCRTDYAHTSKQVTAIRELFKNPKVAGLCGVALCAVLENTSEIFIPDLASRAKRRGCTDFTYTDVHGEADIDHSKAFAKALEEERDMHYYGSTSHLIKDTFDRAVALIGQIYTG